MTAAPDYPIQHYAVETYEDALDLIGQMATDVIKLSPKTYGDETVQARHKAARSIAFRFFKTANPNGMEVLKEVVGFGKTQMVTKARLECFERQAFGKTVLTDTQRNDAIVHINEEIWLPVPYQFVLINRAFHFNLYQPPQITPDLALVSTLAGDGTAARPAPWDEFLCRWFPDCSHSRDVLEAYVAKLIFDPLDRPRWAMIMRSDQGTGKNWLEEHILSPLMGNSNVGSTSLAKAIGRFNAGQFQRKLLIINEVNDDRVKTYDHLKDIVSDSFKMVEEKYQPVRQQQLFLGVWIFSNHDYPIYVDTDDRRFFVTPRIKHKESKEETKEFLMGKMKPFLSNMVGSNDLGIDLLKLQSVAPSGLVVMASWLKHVADSGYNGIDFGSVPHAGNCMSELAVSDGGDALALDLLAELDANKNCYFQTGEIRKHKDFRYMQVGRIQAVLKEAGFQENKQLWGRSGHQVATRRSGWVMTGRGTKALPAQKWSSVESF